MEAVLIQQPVFKVRISHQNHPVNIRDVSSTTLQDRVKAAATGVFHYTALFFSALKDSSRYIVFYLFFALRVALESSYYPGTAGIVGGVCVAIAWVGVATVIFVRRVVVSQRRTVTKLKAENLQEYLVGSRIDLSHFRAVDAKVDMTHVPSTVTLRDLCALLEKVPMADREKGQPGYIAPPVIDDPQTRARRTLLKEGLKRSLNTLIDNIAHKKPWIGAPPQEDKAAVNQFYQKLSDLLRYSLHKVTSEYATFVREHGIPQRPTAESSVEERKCYNKYVDLLETQNRFVVDMAITGNFCAGRAMGDALDAYCTLTGTSQGESGTLQERIVDVLAHTRLTCMKSILQEVYGNGPHSVHYLTAYMAQIGQALGFPGAEGITEQLTKIDDIRPVVIRFFRRYNERMMIRAITDKYQSSGTFRDLVQSWLKERVGTWNQDHYTSMQQELNQKIEELRHDAQYLRKAHQKVGQIMQWLDQLKDEDLDAWSELFLVREGRYFFSTVTFNAEGEEIRRDIPLEEASVGDILTALTSLPAMNTWIADQGYLKQIRELDELLQHLLSKNITFSNTSGLAEMLPHSQILTEITQHQEARRWLLTKVKFTFEPNGTLADLRAAENAAIETWKQAFSAPVLQVHLANFIRQKLARHPQAQMTLRMIQRIEKEEIIDRWKGGMMYPEFALLTQAFVKGENTQQIQEALEKKITVYEQLGRISQHLFDRGIACIQQEDKNMFVDGLMHPENKILQDTLHDHLRRARETEFFTALMGTEGAEGAPFKKELVEWLLIENSCFVF